MSWESDITRKVDSLSQKLDKFLSQDRASRSLDTGWINSASMGFVYWSANQVAVGPNGTDFTAMFPVGAKVRLDQGTRKYFYVTSAVYYGGWSVLTLTGGSDFAIANAAISNPMYSYADTPQGFPQWFNYTGTTTGFTTSTVTEVFCINGRVMTVSISYAATSNAAAFTISLPISAASIGHSQMIRVLDNGVWQAAAGLAAIIAANIISLYKDGAGTGFTASGIKGAEFILNLQI